MGRVGKLRRQLTVDRVSGAADLGVKFAGIVVAVGAIAVVFFGPKIEITTARQTFIDRDALQRQYRDHPDGVPPVVVGVAAPTTGTTSATCSAMRTRRSTR